VRGGTGGAVSFPAMACTAIASVTIPIRAASSAAGDPRGTPTAGPGWKSPNSLCPQGRWAREKRDAQGGQPCVHREVGGAHHSPHCGRNARERAVGRVVDLG